MSKIFFDHLISIEEVGVYIDGVSTSHEEKEELWNLVDEFVNHKIISSILSELDEASHDEFLNMFLDRPYDVGIIDYLNEKLTFPLESLVSDKMKMIISELYVTLEIRSPIKKTLKQAKGKKRK